MQKLHFMMSIKYIYIYVYMYIYKHTAIHKFDLSKKNEKEWKKEKIY